MLNHLLILKSQYHKNNILLYYIFMEVAGIIAILSVAGGVLTGLITTLFHSMSLSRCKNIDCCCIKCDREVLTEDTYRTEQDNLRNENQE